MNAPNGMSALNRRLLMLALATSAACSQEAERARPPAAPSTLAVAAGSAESPASDARATAPSAEAPAASAGAAATQSSPTLQGQREAAAELVLDETAAAAVLPPLPARVVQVHVRPGDKVAAQAPLVTLVVPEAALAAARAVSTKERLALTRERLTAVEALLAQGLARAADRAELVARVAELEAEQALATATLRAAGLGQAQALLASGGRAILRAPIAGIVQQVDAMPGEVRGPSEPPLVRLLGGGGRRVLTRWAATAPVPSHAELQLIGGERRKLTLAATAPAAAGLVQAWYDVEGASLPATASGRVIAKVAP